MSTLGPIASETTSFAGLAVFTGPSVVPVAGAEHTEGFGVFAPITSDGLASIETPPKSESELPRKAEITHAPQNETAFAVPLWFSTPLQRSPVRGSESMPANSPPSAQNSVALFALARASDIESHSPAPALHRVTSAEGLSASANDAESLADGSMFDPDLRASGQLALIQEEDDAIAPQSPSYSSGATAAIQATADVSPAPDASVEAGRPRETSPIPAFRASSAGEFVLVELRRQGGGTIEIRLDPPELGKVIIEVDSQGDEVVRAVVSAERSDTLDLMRRNSAELQNLLEREGHSGVDLSFRDEARRDARNTDESRTAGIPAEGTESPADFTPRNAIRFASAGLDLRL